MKSVPGTASFAAQTVARSMVLFMRSHLYSIAQRDMLQIHDRVGGIRHMAIHTELSLVLA